MRALLFGACCLLLAAGDARAARHAVHRARVPPSALRMVGLTQARTLSTWLDELESPELARTLSAIFTAASEVATKVRTSSCDSIEGCFNSLPSAAEGEEYAIDLLASSVGARSTATNLPAHLPPSPRGGRQRRAAGEPAAHVLEPGAARSSTAPPAPPVRAQIMSKRLTEAGTVSTVSSTQEPYEVPIKGSGFSVAYDPLDSAASVDVNFAVGSSWGVWKGAKLTGIRGRDLAAAGLAMYGPRTAMLVATGGSDGVCEFVLTDVPTGSWEWHLANTYEAIGEDEPFRRAIFAPGNLRATTGNAGYRQLVDHFLAERYHLRYSGGFVPDVVQMVVKGRGIFTNPDGGEAAPARLRLLYEAAPAAFIVEKAGGASSDGERSLLDIVVQDTHQRTQVAVGSKLEVQRFERLVGPAKPS